MDLIERQAAIDAMRVINDSICEQQAVDALYDLPSAPRWIPCEELLPKIDMSHPHHKNYLVQYDSGGMDVASWSNVNRFWTDHVTEPYWNCAQFAKVIAWMPLPEPWKGEDND